jgi:Uma2 family endonuclease
MSTIPGGMTMHDYDLEAQHYLASLPLEHFMEAVPQSKQREITVESLAVLKLKRPDVQYYNELLVQYAHEGQLRKVVPDNMVVIGPPTDPNLSSYPVALMPSPPFWVLEYVSPRNPRKDYVDNFQKYEQELKVPYYLLFEPDRQALSVYRHDGERYVRLEPDANGRVAIEELELEIGLKDHWVRFWHQGELLPIPGEMVECVDQLEADNLRLRVQVRALELNRQEILPRIAAASVTELQQMLKELGQS